MSDLISRSAFIEDIMTEIANLAMDGLKGTPRSREELYQFIDRIKDQPTAYDVDKVAEELEEYKKSKENLYVGRVVGAIIDYAIEIVKGGGVNE